MATSLDVYAPYDSGAGADTMEDTWRKMARHWRGDGVIRNEGGQFEVYGDSTGMWVKVPTGECWIRGHWGAGSVEKTLPIATAHATLGRRDLVVLRNDFVNNLIELDVLTGTPASSPVYPALTQNTSVWEVQVGKVVVDAAVVTIAANKVTAIPTFVDGSCRFGVDAGFQTVTHNIAAAVDFDISQFESSAVSRSGSLHDFKLERTGFWMIVFNLQWEQNSNGHREARIVRTASATVAISQDRVGAVTGTQHGHNVVAIDRFDAGEEVRCLARQSSGGNLQITNDSDATNVTFWWLGP